MEIIVIDLLKKYCTNDMLNLDTELSSLGFDSIIFIEIIVEIEDLFSFDFDNEMLTSSAFPTIKSLIDYIEIKVAS